MPSTPASEMRHEAPKQGLQRRWWELALPPCAPTSGLGGDGKTEGAGDERGRGRAVGILRAPPLPREGGVPALPSSPGRGAFSKSLI